MKVLFEPSKRYMREDKALRRILRLVSSWLTECRFGIPDSVPAFARTDRPGITAAFPASVCLPRKEVIQPHLTILLPCYDFTPVIWLTFGSWLLAVTSLTSGAPNSHGVTGGVYKARERIHRGMLIRDY